MSYEKGVLQRNKILETCLKIAEETDYRLLSKSQICHRCGISAALINWYFGTMSNLRIQLISLAIERNNETIIMQAVGAKHPMVRDRYSVQLKEKGEL